MVDISTIPVIFMVTAIGSAIFLKYKRRIVLFFLFGLLLCHARTCISMEKEALPLLPDRVFNHAPSLLELPDGTLLVAWSSGSREKNRDTAIVYSLRKPASLQWSQPRILVDTPERADGNPVIFLINDEVHCFYSYLWGSGWSTARLSYVKSALPPPISSGRENKFDSEFNGANFSWTFPIRIFPFYRMGDLGRSKPIILNDKEFILPLYKEFSGYYSYVCKFIGGRMLFNSALIKTKPGNLQPAVISLSDGTLFMLMRPEKGLRPRRVVEPAGGYFWQSFSKDKGKTWSDAAERKDLPNPGSGFDLLKLASGNIILVFNDDSKTRTRFSVALSEDEGKSFPIIRILEEEQDVDFAYPSVIQDLKGRIHIVYSVDKREIRHIVLKEEEIYD